MAYKKKKKIGTQDIPGIPTEPTAYAGTVLDDGNHDWRQHKIDSKTLAKLYEDIDLSKTQRLLNCGEMLAFKRLDSGRKKLVKASFCRVRLCPTCQWRRSLKTHKFVKQVTDYIRDHPDEYGETVYILVTFTQLNCEGEELRETLNRMSDAWNRVKRFPEFNTRKKGSYVKGMFVTKEVTHNVDVLSPDFDTYHPHIHVLMAVDPRYFSRKDNPKYYITLDRLIAIWRQAMQLDYDPNVDIEVVRPKMGESLTSAICEVSKYAVKSADYILPQNWQLSHRTVKLLDAQLSDLRFVSFNGIFKTVHKLLHLDDIENGDLTLLGDELDPEEGEIIWYLWHSGYSQYIAV